jgi:cardiolipin synthase
LATLVALSVRDILPWWFTIALLAREAFLGVLLLLLRRRGYGPPAVHYVGKSATFILLLAFPVLLLSHVLGGTGTSSDSAVGSASSGTWWYAAGWGLAWWGLVLYWVAGFFYVVQAGQLVRARRGGAAA